MSSPCPYCGTDAGPGFARCPNCGFDLSAPAAGGAALGATVQPGQSGPAGPEWGKTVVESTAPRPDAGRKARFDRGREFYEAVDETRVEPTGAGSAAMSDHTIIERRHDDVRDDATVIIRSGRRGVTGPLAYLVERSGVRAGKVHLLRSETNIGRGPDNEVTLGDDSVSRRHAKIRLEDGKFMYWDLASANFSFLVGGDGSRTRILEPKLLADGDKIDLGDARVVFILVDAAESSDAGATSDAS